MSVVTYLTMATALTAGRVVSRPGGFVSADLSRVIIGGVLLTVGALAAEQVRPNETRGLAALIFTTSVLVNGVPLAEAVNRVVN